MTTMVGAGAASDWVDGAAQESNLPSVALEGSKVERVDIVLFLTQEVRARD